MIYSYDVVFKFILPTKYVCFTFSTFILHNAYSYDAVYIKYSIFDIYSSKIAYYLKVLMMWV